MLRSVQMVGVIALATAFAMPVSAQMEVELCLHVQTASEVGLSDPLAIQDGIGSGEILVTAVVPCETPSGPSAPPSPDTGAWRVLYDETDPLTDQRRVSVVLDAVSGVSRLNLPTQFLVSCLDGTTRAVVSWGWNLGPERIIEVDVRIDDGEIVAESWLNDGEDSSYGRDDVAFVESLFGESRFAVGVTTPDAGTITAEFDIFGIEDAVTGVREACGW